MARKSGRKDMERVAECHCGQLRAITSGEPESVYVCHCKACQRRTGAIIHNGSRWLKSQVRIEGEHLSTRQYARIVHSWVASAGLDSSAYGTHLMRRTKAAQIYKKTGNLRAVQLLLGHTKLESMVRYLGIEVDDALAISEQVEL